jgi:hypothetical protein
MHVYTCKYVCVYACMIKLDLFTLTNGTLVRPETSARNYHDTIRNNPEERRSHLSVTTVSTKNSVADFHNSLFFRQKLMTQSVYLKVRKVVFQICSP